MTQDEFTPTDRPIMLSDINAIRKAVHRSETATLAMYSEFQSVRTRLRWSLATCIICAVVCLASLLPLVARACVP